MTAAFRDFISGDGLAALAAALCVIGAGKAWHVWRNPNSWHIDGDTKQVVFHAWLDIGIFATIGTVCILALMMGMFF